MTLALEAAAQAKEVRRNGLMCFSWHCARQGPVNGWVSNDLDALTSSIGF